MIGVIDYGAGNIFNVQNALHKLGSMSIVVNTIDQLYEVDKLVIPGVGSFETIVSNLSKMKLFNPLKERIQAGLYTLGICLGYQVLFKESDEAPHSNGLNLIDGRVERLNAGKIPHLGWNKIYKIKYDSIFDNSYQYFVHSYFPKVEDEKIVSTTTNYGSEFASAIEFDNITACQFHPERSGEVGLKFLRRWINVN